MTGVEVAYGPCIGCRRVIAFDVDTTPSVSVCVATQCPIRPDGTEVQPHDPDAVREPLCVPCARRFNAVAGVPTPVRDLFRGARFDLIDLDAYAARVAGEMVKP